MGRVPWRTWLGLMDPVTVTLHQGPEALASLAGPLGSAGLLPAALPEMDPDYLATGLEGGLPAALIAANTGGPVAYMPFVLRLSNLALKLGPLKVLKLPCRQLRLMGVSRRDGSDEAVLDALFDCLLSHFRWDVADICDFPKDDFLFPYLASDRRLPRHGLHIMNTVYEPRHIDIKGTYDGYLKSQFTYETRYNLRRKRRLLEASAPTTLRRYTSGDNVEEFLREAERIAVKTYQRRQGLATIAHNPEMRRRLEFQAERGWLRSYLLFSGDHPCAYCYGTLYRRTFSYAIIGYDPGFRRFSPGSVLLCMILEDLFGTGVAQDLDFGITSADYKELFSTSTRTIFYSRLYPSGSYAQMLRRLEVGWEAIRSRLVAMVRKTPLRSVIRRASLPTTPSVEPPCQ